MPLFRNFATNNLLPSFTMPNVYGLGRSRDGYPALMTFKTEGSKNKYRKERIPEERYCKRKTPAASQNGQQRPQSPPYEEKMTNHGLYEKPDRQRETLKNPMARNPRPDAKDDWSYGTNSSRKYYEEPAYSSTHGSRGSGSYDQRYGSESLRNDPEDSQHSGAEESRGGRGHDQSYGKEVSKIHRKKRTGSYADDPPRGRSGRR
jgi:hypothetical protein